MRAFTCHVCGQLLFFDNSECLRCSSALGFLPGRLELTTLTAVDGDETLLVAQAIPGSWRRCGNAVIARCNWLLAGGERGELCFSCRLTRTRPADEDTDGMAAFADAEAAKRQLLCQVLALGLPVVDRVDDPDGGLAFDFLSSRGRDVITGHQAGVITLDLSESDDAHREFVRLQLGEPYRTVLGHLRHEIGHYFWPRLVTADRLDRFRDLFGDETESYQSALGRHYGTGPPDDWPDRHVSRYATMHPWEDWAETFAHYLHIRGGLETAAEFGLSVGAPSAAAAGDPPPGSNFGAIVADWLGLSLALNAMSTAIGEGALYPFVLAPAVIEKLGFVHDTVSAAGGP